MTVVHELGVVRRSGPAGLEHWLDESRDLYADCHAIVGGSAHSVVCLWLVANSLLRRKNPAVADSLPVRRPRWQSPADYH